MLLLLPASIVFVSLQQPALFIFEEDSSRRAWPNLVEEVNRLPVAMMVHNTHYVRIEEARDELRRGGGGMGFPLVRLET